MKTKSLSTLGLIMEHLNISTVSMSRAIMVDASLVSKWKSGVRNLSGKSIYIDDIIQYIMEQSESTDHEILKSALMELYPHENLSGSTNIETLLRQALTNSKTITSQKTDSALSEGTSSVPILVFENNSGRRDAIRKLLDYAESMTTPGEIVFIDSEEYQWLLEDNDFSESFTKRIHSLLKKGFHAKFIIHYSSYRDHFLKLFTACSSLIFHRNVDWFYYEYYDDTVLDFSLFVLNKSVSMLGFSAGHFNSTTMVFNDLSMVIKHETMANHIVSHCKHLFDNFGLMEFDDIINDLSLSSHGSFYSYLPAPLFITIQDSLLKEILFCNGLKKDDMKKYLEINAKLRNLSVAKSTAPAHKKENFVYIFQLEEMLRRAKAGHFISSSLSLIGNRPIEVSQLQYAKELRSLAALLINNNHIKIILVSEKDHLTLPSINCWNRQNMWMLQMDDHGFRITNESTLVNAASTVLEHCIRKVPPERKENEHVSNYLLSLAIELESDSGNITEEKQG